MKFHFNALLQSSGWIEDAEVETDGAGNIVSIEEAGNVAGASGFAIPGFRNSHSHAFQYAMAGLAERHDTSSTRDDFWGWRNAMYGLALSIDPDQMEAIAAMLYSEMVRSGFTHVAEFHYLHHEKDGRPYANPAEMGERLVAAAETAGINVTLVPIFYQKGGFDRDPLPEQRRFISGSIEEYEKLVEASSKACEVYSGARLGLGIHSLRGVRSEDVIATADLRKDLPFHIHISEQIREVEECEAYLGRRPVDWMLENTELDDRFNFVHATHVNLDETRGMAKAGVNVVLCPSTEGNLGDGIFPLRDFQNSGGIWSIGTDSHVGLDPFEELRLLDYGQRLTTHRRDTFSGSSRSSAENALRNAAFAGMKAMGESEGDYFEVGQPLNACVISDAHPLLASNEPDSLADRIVYASDSSRIKGTIVNGKWIAKDGWHTDVDRISADFRKALKVLVKGSET